MLTIPTIEPTSIIAGDTVSWRISLADFPASAGWILKYCLLSSAGKIDIASNSDGDGHLVTIGAAVSASYTAGDYQVQRYVERGEGETLERYTLFTDRTITVTVSLAAATGAQDTRSQTKRTLDAIDAVLEKRAGRDDLHMEILTGNQRQRIERIPHDQLLKLRGVYARRYWREKNPGKLCPQVHVRFTS